MLYICYRKKLKTLKLIIMKNLVKLIKAEQIKRQNEFILSIKKIDSPDASKLDYSLKTLLPKGKENFDFKTKTALKEYLLKRLGASTFIEINRKIAKLSFSNLQPITEVTITVECKKSVMLGSNTRANAFVYGLGNLTSGSIGGCGYDKESIAFANVLNQIPQFLQLMYELKNKKYKLSNLELFGYGLGYGILPSFEGGVGIGCYDKIFNSIGYEFKNISSVKTFDVYKITKVSAKVQREKKTKLYNYSN